MSIPAVPGDEVFLPEFDKGFSFAYNHTQQQAEDLAGNAGRKD
jgi:hypothetical protein